MSVSAHGSSILFEIAYFQYFTAGGVEVQRIFTSVNKLLNVIMVVCLATMVVLVFGNVVLRYVFHTGITWAEEMSRFMFVWLVFLGAIGALKDNNHLGVDLLVKILPANLKKGAYILSNLIMLYTLWLVLNGSLKMTNHTINSIAPATGLPYAIMNGSGIIMSICMAIILLHNIYQALVEPNAIERLTQMKDSEEMIVEPKPMATQEGVSS